MMYMVLHSDDTSIRPKVVNGCPRSVMSARQPEASMNHNLVISRGYRSVKVKISRCAIDSLLPNYRHIHELELRSSPQLAPAQPVAVGIVILTGLRPHQADRLSL